MTDAPGRQSEAIVADMPGAEAEAHSGSFTSRVLSVVANRRGPGSDKIDEGLLQRLCGAVRSGDSDAMAEVLADLTEARVSPQAISERYISEAARRLGDAWNDDTAGFAEVTIAMSRLQCLLRDLERDTCSYPATSDLPAALVVLPEGESHTLGAMVLAGQLRRRGVSVRLSAGLPTAELCALFEEQSYDMVLVSWASGETLDSLRKLVISIRLCMDCDASIVVGGATLSTIEDVEAQTGADFATCDIDEALTLCGMTVAQDGARRSAMTS
jgi:methanogenic corrinoid protein MtbC1